MAQTADALWFGTDGKGLLRLTDGLETFTVSDGLPSDKVRALLVGKDGRLWIGTRDGVARFESSPNRRAFRAPGAAARSAVAAIVEDRHANLWVGTEGAGIARITGGRVSVYGEAQGLTGAIVSLPVRGSGGEPLDRY